MAIAVRKQSITGRRERVIYSIDTQQWARGGGVGRLKVDVVVCDAHCYGLVQHCLIQHNQSNDITNDYGSCAGLAAGAC